MIRFRIYLFLLLGTLLGSLLLTIPFIFIFNDRGTGVSWGICLGALLCHFLISLSILKYKLIKSIIKTIFYAGILFILFYVISNYLYAIKHELLMLFLYSISILLAWEMSLLMMKPFSKFH